MATTSKSPIVDRTAFLDDLQHRLHHGNAPLALGLTDIDEFKGVNDEFGHDVGDKVLNAWERVLNANLPKGANVVRLGGDEYVVVMPGLSAENALVLLEEVRVHFSANRVDGVPRRVSASVGVAANPPHGATAEELWRAAGEALMRAKREGRDRVALYVEEKLVLKSNYYSKAQLERLAKLSRATDRTEASLLREGLDDLLYKYRDSL